ncbi:uncharacterized protein LOC113326853 [Papaver somniferum]|uniref:uncharacterized protein LOC113326853 n=1 Tax=Papaver somniferum TaxID=3469 RepID=UPI000E7036BB|nr:uncharacterized protein LOC113326853 [Papaver somniferum]
MEKSLGEDRVNSKGLGGRRIWDANSSLYDTFELHSFRRQLDAAIISSARSQSMPHLSSDHRRLLQQQQAKSTKTTTAVSKKSKIFRSLNKFLRSFLRHKANSVKVNKFDAAAECADHFGHELSTIHEYPEWGFNKGFPFEESDDDSNFKIAKKVSDDSIIFNKSKFDEDFIIVKKLPSDRLTSTSAIGISLM